MTARWTLSLWERGNGWWRFGQHATRVAAMNAADRPYRRGLWRIEHQGTGETWERRGGSWIKLADPIRVRRQAEADRPCA